MNTQLNFILASEADQKLGITLKSLGRLIRQGKLPALKISNRWLIDKSILQTFWQHSLSQLLLA